MPHAALTQSPEAILQRHLQERGLKQTRQRSLIVSIFLATGGHLDVDQLLATVRRPIPRSAPPPSTGP